jgi:hypothetical protein
MSTMVLNQLKQFREVALKRGEHLDVLSDKEKKANQPFTGSI